mmetsp:Transcript_12089/g.31023  ORF Transcript_12089/g.31023 Transcript_12089/m.31023 type:complete len:322 (-) Transcript_12089:409-1374(-)
MRRVKGHLTVRRSQLEHLHCDDVKQLNPQELENDCSVLYVVRAWQRVKRREPSALRSSAPPPRLARAGPPSSGSKLVQEPPHVSPWAAAEVAKRSNKANVASPNAPRWSQPSCGRGGGGTYCQPTHRGLVRSQNARSSCPGRPPLRRVQPSMGTCDRCTVRRRRCTRPATAPSAATRTTRPASSGEYGASASWTSARFVAVVRSLDEALGASFSFGISSSFGVSFSLGVSFSSLAASGAASRAAPLASTARVRSSWPFCTASFLRAASSLALSLRSPIADSSQCSTLPKVCSATSSACSLTRSTSRATCSARSSERSSLCS